MSTRPAQDTGVAEVCGALTELRALDVSYCWCTLPLYSSKNAAGQQHRAHLYKVAAMILSYSMHFLPCCAL